MVIDLKLRESAIEIAAAVSSTLNDIVCEVADEPYGVNFEVKRRPPFIAVIKKFVRDTLTVYEYENLTNTTCLFNFVLTSKRNKRNRLQVSSYDGIKRKALMLPREENPRAELPYGMPLVWGLILKNEGNVKREEKSEQAAARRAEKEQKKKEEKEKRKIAGNDGPPPKKRKVTKAQPKKERPLLTTPAIISEDDTDGSDWDQPLLCPVSSPVRSLSSSSASISSSSDSDDLPLLRRKSSGRGRPPKKAAARRTNPPASWPEPSKEPRNSKKGEKTKQATLSSFGFRAKSMTAEKTEHADTGKEKNTQKKRRECRDICDVHFNFSFQAAMERAAREARQMKEWQKAKVDLDEVMTPFEKKKEAQPVKTTDHLENEFDEP